MKKCNRLTIRVSRRYLFSWLRQKSSGELHRYDSSVLRRESRVVSCERQRERWKECSLRFRMAHQEWKRSVAKQFKEEKRIIRLEVDDSSLCRSPRAVLPRSETRDLPLRAPSRTHSARLWEPSRRPENLRVSDYKLWFMSSTWQRRIRSCAEIALPLAFPPLVLHAVLIALSPAQILRPCNFYDVINCHKLGSQKEYNNHVNVIYNKLSCLLMAINVTKFFIISYR